MVKLRPNQQMAVCLAAAVLASGGCVDGDEPPVPATHKVTYLTGFGSVSGEGSVNFTVLSAPVPAPLGATR